MTLNKFIDVLLEKGTFGNMAEGIAMRYKEYGRTGKMVSNLGFGAMRFTPPDDEDNAIRTIHRAVERGINYFDTAPGYCQDLSETYLGKALSCLRHDVQSTLYVSTKTSIESDPKADDVRRRIEDQLRKLQRDRIDFYNMWCIMDLDHYHQVMAPGGPYEGARKALEEGLISHLVCSTHARSEDIEVIVNDGAFEGITLGYNLLNHQLRGPGIRAAAAAGMSVIAMNPLGGGMLCHSESKLGFLRQTSDDSFIAAALRFLFANQDLTVVLAGMGLPEHVDFNANVAEAVAEPDPEIVRHMIETYEKLGEKFCTGCRYCLEHCEEKIQIHLYMHIWDRVRLDMPQVAGRMHEFYRSNNWFKDAYATHCSQCGLCEEFCTQQLPIRDSLARCAELYEQQS